MLRRNEAEKQYLKGKRSYSSSGALVPPVPVLVTASMVILGQIKIPISVIKQVAIRTEEPSPTRSDKDRQNNKIALFSHPLYQRIEGWALLALGISLIVIFDGLFIFLIGASISIAGLQKMDINLAMTPDPKPSYWLQLYTDNDNLEPVGSQDIELIRELQTAIVLSMQENQRFSRLVELARQQNGSVSVMETAELLGMSIPEAERVLNQWVENKIAATDFDLDSGIKTYRLLPADQQ